jgi:serine/threonine-protein kinase
MDIEKAKKAIKIAWIAGIIVGVSTLVFTIIAVAGSDVLGLGLDEWAFVDIFLIFGLTFGIYKKNRVAALIMLIYFVGSKIFVFIQSPAIGALPLALVLGYFFFQGVRGTFAYHRIVKAETTGISAEPTSNM